jgi:acetyl-CoA C-acetyltransferase
VYWPRLSLTRTLLLVRSPHISHSRILTLPDPIDFPIAPAAVVNKLLEQSSLSLSDISVWEFNEAFAAVIKANAKILGLGVDNVNPRGGAIALGHALGSSGSRILVTLLHQLEVGHYGVAAICNGGGAATGMIVKRVTEGDL